MPIYRFLIFETPGIQATGQFHHCADDDEARAHARALLAKHRKKIHVAISCDDREVSTVSGPDLLDRRHGHHTRMP